jgi:hypothetical protein
MFVTRGSKNYLLVCHVCGWQDVGENVQPFNKRMNGHRSDLPEKTLLPVSQHFVSPGHSLEDVGRSKIDIIDHNPSWKEHLCVLQLETALATLVTTWFTLADHRWRSRYRSSDQCILNAFRSPEHYNGWFREQLRQRFTFLKARRQERSIRYFAMSIAKRLMWFTSLTVTSVGRNT